MMTTRTCSQVLILMVSASITALADDQSESASDFVPAKISTSSYHTCMLSKKGQVKCWGYNSAGELGTGTKDRHGREPGTMGANLPVVNFGTNLYAKDVCTGILSTCVATTDGRVKCWGGNNYGQVGQERLDDGTGIGDSANDLGDKLPFTNLGTGFKAKSVHCGAYTNCALSENGKLKCWGRGTSGELGVNISPKTTIGGKKGEMGDNLSALALPTSITHVSLGSSNGCAASKADVYCWGNNNLGQAGIGSTEGKIYLPTDATNAMKVKLEDDGVATVIEGIVSGRAHNCALYHLASRPKEQRVKCWGSNTFGSLGIGSSTRDMGRTADTLGSKLPTTPLALSQILQLEAHDDFSCALTKTGQMKCWGTNTYGQLGVGDNKLRGRNLDEMANKLPFVNLGLPTIGISSGSSSRSSCAILINHEVKCWGYAFYGALGYEDLVSRGTLSDDMGENLPYVRYK